jgi:hypothetical protein
MRYESIVDLAKDLLRRAKTEREVEEIRLFFLGKKGVITQMQKALWKT